MQSETSMKKLLIIVSVLLAIAVGVYAFNARQERIRKIKVQCTKEAKEEAEGSRIIFAEEEAYKECLKKYGIK